MKKTEVKALHKVWQDAFKAACRRRKLRFVSGEGYVVDDVYISALWPNWWVADDVINVRWRVDVKPLALDDVLWAAFMPDVHVQMGQRMRLNRRINGACTVRPLQISDGVMEVAITDDPALHWETLIDEFDRVRADFIDRYPAIPDFLVGLRERDRHPRRNRLSEVLTSIAAGRPEEAVALADAERAAGQFGGMSAGADVYEYVAAYAKGPAAYAQFLTSLIPTHDMTFITERSPGGKLGLRRGRHFGRFADELRQFDGDDKWGLILDVRPSAGEDGAAAVRYLQAAGTVSAMVIELRGPGGREWGAVSVRSIVGRRCDGPAQLDVPIVLPRFIELVSRHEVFDADEAVDLFDAFYAGDEIPSHYTLRPVEGYTVNGLPVSLPPRLAGG